MLFVLFRLLVTALTVAVGYSLSSRYGWTWWSSVLAAATCFLVLYIGIPFSVAALQERKYKRLGIPPFDDWPQDAE
jgi:hypothetical protein